MVEFINFVRGCMNQNLRKTVLVSIIVAMFTNYSYSADSDEEETKDCTKVELTETQHIALAQHVAYIDIAITMNNIIAKHPNEWYARSKYRDSVINQIAYAIAKRINYEDYTHDEQEIVIFKGTDIKNYTQANYNAWLLYNYIDVCFSVCKSSAYISKVPSYYNQRLLYMRTEYKNEIDINKFESACKQVDAYINITKDPEAPKSKNSPIQEIIAFYTEKMIWQINKSDPNGALAVHNFDIVNKKSNDAIIIYEYKGAKLCDELNHTYGEYKIIIDDKRKIEIPHARFSVNINDIIDIDKHDIDPSIFSLMVYNNGNEDTITKIDDTGEEKKKDEENKPAPDIGESFMRFGQTRVRTYYTDIMKTLRSICSSNLRIDIDDLTDLINWGEHPDKKFKGKKLIEIPGIVNDEENLAIMSNDESEEEYAPDEYNWNDVQYKNTYNKIYPYQPLDTVKEK